MTMFTPPMDLGNTRILVVNDDGIRAPGLKVLERIAKKFTRDVWVFAPEEEQSGAGHSLSLFKPIRVKQVSRRRFAVGGSPTDCVMMALSEYLRDKKPDLILSGVNRGANLGDEITYSGTVAGALEATLLCIPAIALSQQVIGEKEQFHTTETLAPGIIEKLVRHEWPRDVFMNVNFPDVPSDKVAGVTVVEQGRRQSSYNLHEMPDPRREGFFYIIGTARRGPHMRRSDSDYRAIDRGEITITPLHCDLTHRGALRALRKEFK